ncbi:MAG: glycosyltransferase family 4 protein [Alphaproteobacteria bacterium]|nr:glycosyltransferase family 4 protein [Alphaproteobacteria bacterium]
MHLVFVSSLLPVKKPVSGFDIANRVILDALMAQGAQVSLLGYLSPDVQPAEAARTVSLGVQEVTTARASTGDKMRWLAGAFANGTTISSAKMLVCGRKRVQSALRSLAPFDGLVLNSVQLAGAFLPVFSEHDSIFIAHNVEALTAAENARHASGPLERVLFRREARLFEELERKLCLGSRFVWTLSEEDRRTLNIQDDNKSAALPMVTGPQPPSAPEGMRDLRYDLGMIGTWSWRPNRVGLDWFLNDVAPLLPNNLTIAIAGDLPNPPTGHLHPGIRFVGRVPDARTFLAGCAVIPLASTVGTGVQLKTIETFEMGLPSVATPSALRGVKTTPSNCVIAADAGQFAEALIGAVKTARKPSATALDGRPFHNNQIAGLSEAIERGLVRLGKERTVN